MRDNFKFRKGDTAYTVFASVNNGKKVFYEKVIIDDSWCDSQWGNHYSFIHSNGGKCNSCPEKFLYSDKDYTFKQLKNGLYI